MRTSVKIKTMMGARVPMMMRVQHAESSRVFFFQAEDGIRDYKVTGVQTCALPISDSRPAQSALAPSRHPRGLAGTLRSLRIRNAGRRRRSHPGTAARRTGHALLDRKSVV